MSRTRRARSSPRRFRRRRAEPRGQRADPARGAVREPVDPTGRRRCRWCARGSAAHLAPVLPPAAGGRAGQGKHARRVPGAGVLAGRDPAVSRFGRGSLRADGAGRAAAASRGAAGSGEGRGVVRRANGVRPACIGSSEHPRGCPQSPHAGADESQDQVPRGIPSLRPERAAGAGERLFRARLRLALHATGRARAQRAADSDDRRAAAVVGH